MQHLAAELEMSAVEQHPDGEDDVEIGVVGEDRPRLLAQIETAQHQRERLLAGRQRERSHAALVMIEIHHPALGVDERLALRGAVEEDGALGRLARGAGRRDDVRLTTTRISGASRQTR